MDNSSVTSEPAPDDDHSPFGSVVPLTEDHDTEPPPRGVGDSMRVADIILLTVVVAVLTAIAVRGVDIDLSADPTTIVLRAALVAVSALMGLFGTVIVERSFFASLFGAAVGAAVAAAVPALLANNDATGAVVLGGGVLVATGAVLGALRRRGELAALGDEEVEVF